MRYLFSRTSRDKYQHIDIACESSEENFALYFVESLDLERRLAELRNESLCNNRNEYSGFRGWNNDFLYPGLVIRLWPGKYEL